MSPPKLGEKIKMLRDLIGLNQQELAEKCGLSVSYISKLESSAEGHQNPTIGTVSSIASALGVKWPELIYYGERTPLPQRLRLIRQMRGMTIKQLSKKTDIPKDDLIAFENGSKFPDPIAMNLIALVLEVDYNKIAYFEDYSEEKKSPPSIPLDIPEIGSNKASTIFFEDEGTPRGKWPQQCWRPNDITDPHAFAIRVEDDFMEPAFKKGTVLICVTNEQPQEGDWVTLLTLGHFLYGELSYDKERVVIKLINPKYRPFVFDKKEIRAIHRVVWIRRK